jgi:hypothetical protein
MNEWQKLGRGDGGLNDRDWVVLAALTLQCSSSDAPLGGYKR